MIRNRPISKKRKAFRRILLLLALLAFIFAGFMSFYYVGHKRGYIQQEDIAPTVFATDVYLYKFKAYWASEANKFKIAKKLLKLGFFDEQYYYAGQDLMGDLAESGHSQAQVIHADYLIRQPDQQYKAINYYQAAADQGNEVAQERVSYFAALSIMNER